MRLSWKNNPVPGTRLVAHVPGPRFFFAISTSPSPIRLTSDVAGWTIFDNLYILNGIIYVVTDDRDSMPDVSSILSKGIRIEPGRDAELARLPTDEHIRIISTGDARRLFGTGATIIDGVTVRFAQPP